MTTVSRIAAGCVLASAPLLAHHGVTASYDTAKTFTIRATVREFHFANPHPQLLFDVTDEQGNVVHWGGEIAPNPMQLAQAGWGRKRSEAALAPGAGVTITLSPSGTESHVGLIEKIVNAAGVVVLGAISTYSVEDSPSKKD